jgi:transcriptional regulator with XRE-family HTH domain
VKGRRIVARKFAELESKMSPDSIARSNEKVKALRRDMALNELRAALEITQQHLATRLGVNQAAISKLERRADMYVSTLSDFIRAMGGNLEINARFPEGSVRISQFSEVKIVTGKTIKKAAKTLRARKETSRSQRSL